MKLSKDELKQKISDNIKDNDDLVIELLEDIDDSVDVSEDVVVSQADYDNVVKERDDYKVKYEDIKERYKSRFLSPAVEEKEEEKVEETTDGDGLQEEEVIDVKEI